MNMALKRIAHENSKSSRSGSSSGDLSRSRSRISKYSWGSLTQNYSVSGGSSGSKIKSWNNSRSGPK